MMTFEQSLEEHNQVTKRRREAKEYLHKTHPSTGHCDVCAQDAPCRVRDMLDILDAYEDGITWITNCTNCARMFNTNYAQYERIEEFEQMLKDSKGHPIQEVARHMEKDNQRDAEIKRLRAALQQLAEHAWATAADAVDMRRTAMIALASPTSDS